MARSQKEQETLLQGPWDWQANKANIQTFFTQGIQRAKNWDTLWTMGIYYSSGMKVPDDVTLLWTDDNVGNLIRVPIANETNRAGGAGVYCHFDYVGSPRNYKWINTIQLVKTWEQMHLAYNKNVRQIWLFNVGDLKPLVSVLHLIMV